MRKFIIFKHLILIAMNLELVEILWKYSMFPAAKLPNIANQQLQKGFYGPATAEIAGMSEPSEEDIGDLFERSILEIKKDFLTDEEMPEFIARALVDKELEPQDGIYVLAKLYEDLNFPQELKIFHLLHEEYAEYIPPKYLPHLKENALIPIFKNNCHKDIIRTAGEYLKGKKVM
jgi:hypothetical protein